MNAPHEVTQENLDKMKEVVPDLLKEVLGGHLDIFCVNYFNSDEDSIDRFLELGQASLISASFIWLQTEEGHFFWRRLNDKYLKLLEGSNQ